MQPCFNGLKGLSFDIADNSKWEYVFSSNTLPGYAMKETEDDLKDEDERKDTEKSLPFELPFSWVDYLTVPQEKYDLRTPNGAIKRLFQNAQVVCDQKSRGHIEINFFEGMVCSVHSKGWVSSSHTSANSPTDTADRNPGIFRKSKVFFP
jgi:hypothetical protein